MANTRKFEHVVQLDSGLIIPTSAAKGKRLISDASGVGTWAREERERTYAIAGVLTAKLYPGMYLRVPATGEKKLIAIEYSLAAGEMEFELRLNASAATGFTALKAKTEVKETKPEAVALANKDLIRLKVLSVTGAEDLSLTLIIEI